MRFVFAALIAVLVVALDFEKPAESVTNRTLSYNTVVAAPVFPEAQSPQPANRVTALAGSDTAAVHISTPGGVTEFESVVSNDEEASEEGVLPPSPNQLCNAMKSAAEESGIPVGFFARLLWQESRFRSGEVSSAGARGIAQFMPGTAAEMGLNDPFDALQAIPASARLLRKLHNQFGNLGLAAAAYNAGGGRIEQWLSRRGPLPKETRAYVRIITGHKAEDWTAASSTVSMPTHLPEKAPCEGISGDRFMEVPVTLTSSVSEMMQKAEADDIQRKRMAELALLRTNKRHASATRRVAAEVRSKKTRVFLARKGQARKLAARSPSGHGPGALI